MTPAVIFNQAIERLEPKRTRSRYSSDTVEDWSEPTSHEVGFLVSVQPVASTEGPVERPQAHQQFRLFTPPGTDIPELVEASRVRVGGVLDLVVVGPPARWPDPYNPGVVHHLEATLEVWSG